MLRSIGVRSNGPRKPVSCMYQPSENHNDNVDTSTMQLARESPEVERERMEKKRRERLTGPEGE